MAAEPSSITTQESQKYRLPSLEWSEIVVDPILEARLREFGTETLLDLGILCVFALEQHLTGCGVAKPHPYLGMVDSLSVSGQP